MSDWKKVVVRQEESLRSALSVIDRSGMQIALVVDSDGRLLGTLTDGDARRAMLAGQGLDEPVTTAMHESPTTGSPLLSRVEALALMRRRGISQLPVITPDGRLTDLYLLKELLEPEHRENLVVIAAGGLGMRLRPWTEEVPKPMLEVGGRPLLERIVEDLQAQGFRRIFVSLHHKGQVIEDHFGDGSSFGVEIRYLREDRPLGTAGALRLLPETPDSPILALNGDLLTTVRFGALIDAHLRSGSCATLAIREYEQQVPFGLVVHEGDRLVDLVEKPVKRHSVSAGIYVLSPSALRSVPPDGAFQMPDLLLTLLAGGEIVRVFPLREYWLDIGHPQDWEPIRGANPEQAKR